VRRVGAVRVAREELEGARAGRADAIEVDECLDGQGLAALRRSASRAKRCSPSSASARAEADWFSGRRANFSIRAGSSSFAGPAVVAAEPLVLAHVATSNGNASQRTAVEVVI